MEKLIYFDNAATTFPKPPRVSEEMKRCVDEYCGNPGRSSHALAMRSAEKIFECRSLLAGLFGSEKPENVIFTLNTTYALNLALKSFLRDGGHVIISNMEHNSVLRPVRALEGRGISYDILNVIGSDEQVAARLRRLISAKTCLVICCHMSNICGVSVNAAKIAAVCRHEKIPFVLDCAQSAGTLDISFKEIDADVICAPAHKGLYGTQGCGFALFSDRYSGEEQIERLTPFCEGGNGVNSLDYRMPPFLPERFESGTMPTPAIAALCEGIKYIRQCTPSQIRERERRLCRRLWSMIAEHRKIEICNPPSDSGSILLFNVKGIPSSAIAEMLGERGICVRGGFHCAPIAHNTLHTGADGAVRVSLGAFNRAEELDEFRRILFDIIQ